MVSEKNLANAVGGKTARACDSCIRKRARWYCAADDAFLCQTCDGSVHSANPLARRHERVRLKTASIKLSEEEAVVEDSLPSWHQGFTRKARTPRNGKRAIHRGEPESESERTIQNPLHLVPEIGSDETSHEENEAQLLYRVPIFVAELCKSTTSNEPATTVGKDAVGNSNGSKAMSLDNNMFLPSDMDLADFAADVENLLGNGLDEESYDMEGLGLMDCKERDSMEGSSGSGRVKVEEEEEEEDQAAVANHVDTEIDLTREPFELNFDYDCPVTCEQGENAGAGYTFGKESTEEYEVKEPRKKKILLALDYEGVIADWADQRSPWTTGDRPELDPNDCWLDHMGVCGTSHHPYGDVRITSGHTAMLDGGREARVSRYREKRRTRLFSKKIRYEVRKLNAERRPRMKGRFVKRASFAGPGFPLLNK